MAMFRRRREPIGLPATGQLLAISSAVLAAGWMVGFLTGCTVVEMDAVRNCKLEAVSLGGFVMLQRVDCETGEADGSI